MSAYITNSVDDWIRDLKGMLCIYPRMSRKFMSKDTVEKWNVLHVDQPHLQRSYVNQIEVEKLYLVTGYKLDSVCEMKQVWYVGHPEPRTYYTSGATAYHASKYMHVLTLLADKLTCTKRYFCTAPERLTLRQDHSAFIYDLTSFTSLLHEHSSFLYCLGRYCRGHRITIVDSFLGYVHLDLGELILEYNSACYNLPEFEVVFEDLHYVVCHLVASMLGIYGNIDSAKFIHGAVLLQTCESTAELNVAGDDGIVSTDNEDETSSVVSRLGTISREKTFNTFEDGCVHLKRPIKQNANKLQTEKFAFWPSPEYTIHRNQLDPRYPRLASMTKSEIQHAAASSVVSFLQQLETAEVHSDDIPIVRAYLNEYYNSLGLPYHGSVPQFGGKVTMGFVPRVEDDYIQKNPIVFTTIALYKGQSIITMREKLHFSPDMLGESSFKANSAPLLTYLTKLGYLRAQPVKDIVLGQAGFEFTLYDLSKDKLNERVYQFTVINCVPQWIIDKFLDVGCECQNCTL
jgi:hypothetical protein